MKTVSLLIRSALLLFLTTGAFAATTLTIPVELQPGITSNVAVHVISNPNATPSSEDVLIVHGLAQTGATFEPLANALIGEGMGNKVGNVLIMELPGHGASSPPTIIPFGLLTLEDYTTAVLEVLEALPAQGYTPDVLIGHSMGAAIVQLAQNRLIESGSTLREAHDVRGAVLIAPVILPPSNWAFVESGLAAAILSQFIAGLDVVIPAPVWAALFYGDRSGNVVGAPADPTPFISNEALFAGGQVVRAPGLPVAAPEVDAGIFAESNGTVAGVVTLEQDFLFSPGEHQALYSWLTGDESLKFFTTVTGPSSVHNMHTFDPDALTHAIKKVLNASH